jgi:hypothetical protein
MLTTKFILQCIFYTDNFLQNFVHDIPSKEHDVYILPILYTKPSSHLISGRVRLKISHGHLEYTEFRSSHFCNRFDIVFHYICYTPIVTARVVTYLQYENIQITFVIGINTRIDDMACRKSSLYMYTATNMPINVLQLHIVTVTI